MRCLLFAVLLVLFLASAYAVQTQKAVLVTYPEDTPESEVHKAINAVKASGGVVTHEFKLLKGFAAKASQNALEAVKALGEKYVPFIEDDLEVEVLNL